MAAMAADAALSAYAAAYRGELLSAAADARRYLWEARLSGALQEECLAMRLFGDVLAAGGHPELAVEAYVCRGPRQGSRAGPTSAAGGGRGQVGGLAAARA
jgi:hypothetical protein